MTSIVVKIIKILPVSNSLNDVVRKISCLVYNGILNLKFPVD